MAPLDINDDGLSLNVKEQVTVPLSLAVVAAQQGGVVTTETPTAKHHGLSVKRASKCALTFSISLKGRCVGQLDKLKIKICVHIHISLT